MDIANTTDFLHDGVIEIAPQSCRNARATCAGPATVASPPIIKSAASMTSGAAVAKAAWSMPSDYWLIGIIIVLVTVILMLIVYILRKRNEQSARHGGHSSDADTESKSDPQPEPTAAGEDYHSDIDDAITQTVQRKFVPRVLPTHERPIIEDLSIGGDTRQSGAEDSHDANAATGAPMTDADIEKNPPADAESPAENICARGSIDPPSQSEDTQRPTAESNVISAEETPEIRTPKKRGRASQR